MNTKELNYKEFRCGNLVEFEGKAYPLHIVCDEYPFLDTDAFGVGVVRWNNIQPIQLTEELLVSFGFELHDYTDEELAEEVNFGLRNCCVSACNGFVFEYADGLLKMGVYDNEGDEKMTEVPVKYLHQLQNLYWCLCGEELDIVL